MTANRLGDYAGIYLCQSLLFVMSEEKIILVYRTSFSLTLADHVTAPFLASSYANSSHLTPRKIQKNTEIKW